MCTSCPSPCRNGETAGREFLIPLLSVRSFSGYARARLISTFALRRDIIKLPITVHLYVLFRSPGSSETTRAAPPLSPSLSLSANCESQLARAALNHPFLITISNGPRLTRINYLRWQYSAPGGGGGEPAAVKRSLPRHQEEKTHLGVQPPSRVPPISKKNIG